MSIISRLRKVVDLLRRARDGAVAVEFAIIIPFAMTIYAGGAYTAGMVTLNKKMQSAAYAMVNSVPFPRTVCSYRTYVENMYGSGFQVTALQELLSPFPVTSDNLTVRYIETAPDADGKFTSRVRVEYKPTDGGLRVLANMYSAFGGPRGLESSVVWAESAAVTITNDIPVCPDTPLTIKFDPNASVTYFEVLNGGAYNNTVTASGGVKFQNKYRPYSVSNLPPGLTFAADTGKFGTAINYPCQPGNPGCDPVTLPATVFSVQDYRDKLYDSGPAQASVTGQFVVYYPMTIALTAGSGVIYQGSAIAAGYQPRATVRGGWKIGGAPKGYTFTATNLPSGLWVDGYSGDIQGTTSAWPGSYAVTLTATDSRGTRISTTYSLEVRAQPLQVSVANLTMTYGQYGAVAVTALGGAGVISVSCANLPAGLTCGGSGVVGQAAAWQTVGWEYGTPTVFGDFYPTVTVWDQAGNSASQIMKVSIAVPAVSHYFGGWNQAQAGVYTVGYVYTSGGSGNFSLYACGAPPGMRCGQSGGTFYFDNVPSPGSGTAWLQFRDNVTGIVYTQYASFTFTSPPISVWVVSKWGNAYPGGDNYTSWGASGGSGGLSTYCSGALPYTSGWTCYGYPGSVGWFTSYMTVTDAYGQSAYAAYSFYISPPPLYSWASSGFTFTYCRYGCIGEQWFASSGGYGSRYVSSVTSSPDSQPGVAYWDGTSAKISTWWGQYNSSITVYIADGAGQVAAAGGGF